MPVLIPTKGQIAWFLVLAVLLWIHINAGGQEARETQLWLMSWIAYGVGMLCYRQGYRKGYRDGHRESHMEWLRKIARGKEKEDTEDEI